MRQPPRTWTNTLAYSALLGVATGLVWWALKGRWPDWIHIITIALCTAPAAAHAWHWTRETATPGENRNAAATQTLLLGGPILWSWRWADPHNALALEAAGLAITTTGLYLLHWTLQRAKGKARASSEHAKRAPRELDLRVMRHGARDLSAAISVLVLSGCVATLMFTT